MKHGMAADWTVRWLTRVYQHLLMLYPADFQAVYTQEMKEIFQARCLEIYNHSGRLGIGRWLWRILAGEMTSVYQEYVEMTTELFEDQPEARKTLALGILFLAGTWIMLFFIASTANGWAGLLPGSALVLINAFLVAHSLVRSRRIESIAGMAAMVNMVLLAALLAVQASPAAQESLIAVPVQVLLVGLHAMLLWRLRGEDLTDGHQELWKGEME
jgi:hypothetical protein